MSVRYHESLCFDSTKYRLDWRDDFWGDSIDARWCTVGAGAGSAAVVDAQDGGVCRLTTDTAVWNYEKINWGATAIRSLLVSKKVTMECRVKAGFITDIQVILQLRYDANNFIGFDASNNGTYLIQCKNGGALTSVGSGIAQNTSYKIFKIECFPTGEVHFYIDDVETSNSPITTNITAQYLMPELQVNMRGDASGVARTLDIDYVCIRQER